MNTVEPDLFDDDTNATIIELQELFSPTAPVNEAELFSGRTEQLSRLVSASFQRGQHVALYGDSGVGKTSLINTFGINMVPKSRRSKLFSARCYEGDTFEMIWTRVFGEHQWDNGDYAFDDIDSSIDPDSLIRVVSRFGASTNPIFVFDEFDRIDDEDCNLRMAETIKLFSDASPNATIIVVGIGQTIEDLIRDHRSVQRALRQIEMPRMQTDEIEEIVRIRIVRARMSVTDGALGAISYLSRGLPGYAHLLGLYSAQHAIQKGKSKQVNGSHVLGCLSDCLSEVSSSVVEAYADAVQSSRTKIYEDLLLACATVDQDDFGRFSASAVKAPLELASGKSLNQSAYNKYLNAFCNERGPVLMKRGNPKSFKFSFIDPLMQSFVLMNGVHKDRITLRVSD